MKRLVCLFKGHDDEYLGRRYNILTNSFWWPWLLQFKCRRCGYSYEIEDTTQ